MVFDNIENIKYTKYDKNAKKTTSRRIYLDVNIAEELNKIIAVYNKHNKKLKMDTSDICNIVLKDYFKKLEKMEDKAILNMLLHENLTLNKFI